MLSPSSVGLGMMLIVLCNAYHGIRGIMYATAYRAMHAVAYSIMHASSYRYRWLLAVGKDRPAVQWLTAVALSNGFRSPELPP